MDHEKLDVYRGTHEVVRSISTTLKSKDIHRQRDQVVHSSASFLLNIAEGTSKRAQLGRRHYYEIARVSAMEAGAALDALLVWQCASLEQVEDCKAPPRRVVAMLTRSRSPLPEGCSRARNARRCLSIPSPASQ